MSDMDPLRNLAAALSPDASVSAQLVKGIITDTSLATTPPTVSLQLGGDTSTTIAGVRFMDSYWPVIGDTVQLVKQGSTLLVLGQVAVAGVALTAQGWVAPSPLGTNFATGSPTSTDDPVLYRLVLDNGTKKIQLRGQVRITSGTPTALWTMPTALRPAVKLAPIPLARSFGEGGVTAQIDVNVNGTIVLVATTVGVKATSGQTGVGGGSAVTGLNGFQATQTSTSITDLDLTNGHNAANHSHFDGQHTHLGGAHQHPLDPVGFPTFVSFNGVEYFI